MENYSIKLHRDIYPHTDYGYTWVESIQLVRDGRAVSPIMPSAGFCDRTSVLPGGAITLKVQEELRRYGFPPDTPFVKSETVHEGYYKVGQYSITKVRD